MQSQVYKIPPFINNSFEDTLKEFVEYIRQEYKVQKIIFTESKISPDKCEVGGWSSQHVIFKKPEYIFVSLVFMSKDGWTNRGGYEVCTCKLYDKSNIFIRWSTSGKADKELNIKFIRKIKLKNLENLI